MPTYEQTKEKFLAFLSRGRTEREINKKFGEQGKAFLSAKFPGYSLFQTRNQWNEIVYVLLPLPKKELRLQRKRWRYHIGSDNGARHPYLMVQLPAFEGKILIAPLFDVHYGHQAYRHEKFLAYLRWIAENDNVYAIIGGDLMENALDDGRGMSYDQEKNPTSQINETTTLLAPIAHKILAAIPGNHEARTLKRAGVDPMMVIADKLRVPYFDGPVFISISANSYRWLIYAHHGTGNAQTKGGKLNSANRPKVFTNNVHFLLSGHVHDCLAEPEIMISEDPVNCRLVFVKQWTVVAPSFLEWLNSYAYRAEYRPAAGGGVAIELFDNGDYRAGLTS